MSNPFESGSAVKNLDSILNVNDTSYNLFRENFASLSEPVKYSINNLFNKEGGFNETEYKGKEGNSYIFENPEGKRFYLDVSKDSPSLTIQESGPELKIPSSIEPVFDGFLKGENQGFKTEPETHKGIEAVKGEISGSAGILKGDFYKINDDGSAFRAEGQFNVLEGHVNANAGGSTHGFSADIQVGANIFKADGGVTIITKPEPVFDNQKNEIVIEQKEFGLNGGLNLGGDFSFKDRDFSMEGGIQGNMINDGFSTSAKDIVSFDQLDKIQKEGIINTQRDLEIKILNDGTGGSIPEMQQNMTSAADARIELQALNNYKQTQNIKIEDENVRDRSNTIQDYSLVWQFEEELSSFGHSLGLKPSTLKSFGMDPVQLSQAGYDIKDIKGAGFTVDEFEKSGLTPTVLIQKGLNVTDLKDLGFDSTKLLNEGFDSNVLKASGYEIKSIVNDNDSNPVNTPDNINENNGSLKTINTEIVNKSAETLPGNLVNNNDDNSDRSTGTATLDQVNNNEDNSSTDILNPVNNNDNNNSSTITAIDDFSSNDSNNYDSSTVTTTDDSSSDDSNNYDSSTVTSTDDSSSDDSNNYDSSTVTGTDDSLSDNSNSYDSSIETDNYSSDDSNNDDGSIETYDNSSDDNNNYDGSIVTGTDDDSNDDSNNYDGSTSSDVSQLTDDNREDASENTENSAIEIPTFQPSPVYTNSGSPGAGMAN